MDITTTNYGSLTVGTTYQVKFSYLQRVPEYIKPISNSAGTVEFQYTDSSGNQLAGTANAYANATDTIFLLIL